MRRRQLGQNFLADDRVATRMVDLAAVGRGDLVVEFGSGRGALTRPLLDRGARVVAVGLEPDWAATLRRELGDRGDLEVVAGDALEVALPTAPFRVVANPPFGATTAILRRLLGGDAPLIDATLLLQLETARRVSGAPAAGRLDVALGSKVARTVTRTADVETVRPPSRLPIEAWLALFRALPAERSDR